MLNCTFHLKMFEVNLDNLWQDLHHWGGPVLVQLRMNNMIVSLQILLEHILL